MHFQDNEVIRSVDKGHLSGIIDGAFARPDFLRQERVGVPEVILADRKRTEDALAITRRFMEERGQAILSRVPDALEARLREEWAGGQVELTWYPSARGMVLHSQEFQVSSNGGRVGVLTAGTADVPIAEEAVMLLREMGCQVEVGYDVGVAGLHRLWEPLRRLVGEFDADALIVAAGMDGALPSVVSGLVDIPVVGLPTSIGYGMGGGGQSALLSMLQTCSPGLAVVNIDNGIGAAAMAGLISLRAARARAGLQRSEGVA
jgi:pyridinium-3,5-biscarboxylic acid mononucleotide synthase